MAQQTTKCAYFIRDCAMNKNFCMSASALYTEMSLIVVASGERALKNSFMSDVDSKIKQYEDKFKELNMAFQNRVILHTGLTVSHIFDNVESLGESSHYRSTLIDIHLAVNFDLGDMPYANGARFGPDKRCLPGTREKIAEII
jgi:hypothetical protein